MQKEKNMDIDKKLEKYFEVTKKALKEVKVSSVELNSEKIAKDFLDMAQRYYADAHYFLKKGDKLNALVAVTYAHAWLDAGARLNIFKVKDSRILMQ